MDWRMPIMDGRQATNAIRAMEGGRQTKIAVVTASAFAEERAEILAAGVDEFVRKPFRPEDVFASMARLLGVRYTFDEGRAMRKQQTDWTLTPGVLAVLPEGMRQELADALTSLDTVRISETIRRASELDRDLGAKLSRQADSLAFTPILKALEALRRHAEVI
jgi:CheY-like chemotaxis protein